jgi:carbon monoxide dehydrogenase subunit G
VIEAKIEGKPHGIVGRLSATSAASFVEKDGGTAIQYAVEASLTGRLGSIGQPVLKTKAKEMERLFVQNLRNGLKTGVEEGAP